MASNIVADTIDDTYPVAGQDNNSQGFRDNFNIIKTNFTAAKSEIETLQDDTAKTNADNVFFENTLERFVKKQETSAHIDGLSGISANADLNFTGAHYFTVKAQDDITLTLTGWPTNNEYGEMFIQVYGDGASSRTITFAGTYSSGIASSMRVDASTEFAGGAAITTNTVTTRSHVVKAFTYDNGVTVFLQYVGTFTTTS